MTLTVLTAVAGVWEAPLVSGLERSGGGVVVVGRCVDLPELLAAAAAGRARAVLLSADLRRLDRAALDRLAAARVAVVGVTDPSQSAPTADGVGTAERRLRLLGVRHVVPADAGPEQIAAAVTAAVQDLAAGAPTPVGVADPLAALSPAGWPDGEDDVDWAAGPAPAGRLLAVWGPAGAPGRTSVAVTLAAELAAAGEPTLLADADTYAASVAQVLGLLDESPGLAAACRAAGAGTLDAGTLARLAPEVAPRLRVLTGISRSARWPELAGGALEAVWSTCRQVARWTVVDCAAPLEADEELSFDVAAPRRNAATLVSLADADTVLAVGAADPVGLQRLVRGLQELTEAVPAATARVVVTRVRASSVGANPGQRVSEALARYAAVHDVVLVPDDRAACDAALLAGRTLTEAAGSSPARQALSALAQELIDGSGDADAAARGRPGPRRRRRSARLRA
jgi:MinD-like ATPase involved in chromosome partitioning or flagellar assembly